MEFYDDVGESLLLLNLRRLIGGVPEDEQVQNVDASALEEFER